MNAPFKRTPAPESESQAPTDARASSESLSPTRAGVERFFKLKEVQAMLGVSRTTIWRWHAERGLKIVTVGGVTRIRESDLEAFLRKHEQKAAAS